MKYTILAVAVATALLSACGGSDSPAVAATPPIVTGVASGKAVSSSANPYITPIESGVQIASILTTGDAVGTYRMAGIPDGLGAYDNGDNTFTVLMNHELGNTTGVARAHGGIGAFVSEWVIDKTTLQVKSGSDLMKKVYAQVNGAWAEQTAVAFHRFCSADLPSAGAFYNSATGNGSSVKIFMNGEESANGTVNLGRGLAIVASGADKGKAYILPHFGGFTTYGVGWENLLAHPNSGDKTIVMGNSDSGSNGVYMYVGTKNKTGATEVDKAGLTNGTLYRVVVNVNGAAVNETTGVDAGLGLVNNVTTFSFVPNVATTGVAGTSFLRPEDGAWDTINKNRYYFVTTSQPDAAKDGNTNSSIPAGQIGRTRLWSMTFTDLTKPELGGILEMVLNGTETVTVAGRVHGTQMFDNLVVASDGTIILQEDVGGNNHNGKIWKYNPVTKALTLLAQHDVALFGDYYTNTTGTETNDEETSGIIEITNILGRTDGKRYFLFVDQNHKLATGTNAAELVEGGQLLLLSF
jgi:hypothetical protein